MSTLWSHISESVTATVIMITVFVWVCAWYVIMGHMSFYLVKENPQGGPWVHGYAFDVMHLCTSCLPPYMRVSLIKVNDGLPPPDKSPTRLAQFVCPLFSL